MNNKSEETIENLRTGYEVANNLWIMSDQNYWAIFNAFLVANTILLTGIGWFFSKDPSGERFLNYLSLIIIPIVGFLICVIWFFISHRRILGPAMIGISIFKLWKNNNEINAGNFKFIASLGTIIVIVAILLYYFGTRQYGG